MAEKATTKKSTEPTGPAISLERFASRHATRVDADGVTVRAAALMGGFVHEQRQAGRPAATEAEYLAEWEAFKKR